MIIIPALSRAIAISRQADIIAAMSLDCLKGTSRAFDSRIHKLRPHNGQITVAQRLRTVLHSEFHPSKIAGGLIFIFFKMFIIGCCSGCFINSLTGVSNKRCSLESW